MSQKVKLGIPDKGVLGHGSFGFSVFFCIFGLRDLRSQILRIKLYRFHQFSSKSEHWESRHGTLRRVCAANTQDAPSSKKRTSACEPPADGGRREPQVMKTPPRGRIRGPGCASGRGCSPHCAWASTSRLRIFKMSISIVLGSGTGTSDPARKVVLDTPCSSQSGPKEPSSPHPRLQWLPPPPPPTLQPPPQEEGDHTELFLFCFFVFFFFIGAATFPKSTDTSRNPFGLHQRTKRGARTTHTRKSLAGPPDAQPQTTSHPEAPKKIARTWGSSRLRLRSRSTRRCG